MPYFTIPDLLCVFSRGSVGPVIRRASVRGPSPENPPSRLGRPGGSWPDRHRPAICGRGQPFYEEALPCTDRGERRPWMDWSRGQARRMPDPLAHDGRTGADGKEASHAGERVWWPCCRPRDKRALPCCVDRVIDLLASTGRSMTKPRKGGSCPHEGLDRSASLSSCGCGRKLPHEANVLPKRDKLRPNPRSRAR